MPEPKVAITGFEAEIGTRYTLDTLRYLKRRCPGVRFVWIMGDQQPDPVPPLAGLAGHRPR